MTVLCAFAHADVQTVIDHPTPDRIRPQVFVLAADWLGHVPPSGRLNSPTFISTVYPGQKIALGLLAEGPDRDRAFDRVTIEIHMHGAGGSQSVSHALKPVAVRRIKAEGADMAIIALGAAGISAADKAKLEDATAIVTLAVFVPNWTVPMVAHGTDLDVAVDVLGASAPVSVTPAHLNIKTTEEWLREPEPLVKDLDRQLNHYVDDVPPGQLLSWFVSVTKGGLLHAPPIDAFFALKFKSSAAARDAAIVAYPTLEPKVAANLLGCLRRAGQDIHRLFPNAPPHALAAASGVEPLADPRDFTADYGVANPGAMTRMATRMDECWGGWNATGDKSYLRAIVELLGAAADYPALKNWQVARGGVEGLNEHVAKGLAYQIAGWSIGSFQRTDPLVADWLDYWQHDQQTPATLRAEIASLPTNPAFRRN